jgi:hypothetical protein
MSPFLFYLFIFLTQRTFKHPPIKASCKCMLIAAAKSTSVGSRNRIRTEATLQLTGAITTALPALFLATLPPKAPEAKNFVFRRLYPFSPQQPRQCLGPTWHLSTPN